MTAIRPTHHQAGAHPSSPVGLLQVRGMSHRRICSLMLGIALFISTGAAHAADPEKPDAAKKAIDRFAVVFDVGLVPSEKSAHVDIQLGAGSEAVEWIRFPIDPLRYRAIEANGTLEEMDGILQWTPPESGGSFRYVFSIDHLRSEQAYDARCAKSWAIFRGQDLVPSMRIRTTPGAESDSTLNLRLPEGWSSALPHRPLRGGRYDLSDSRTRFDRPKGWFAFGDLGVARETIEGTRLAVVGPAGQGSRRMDALAMLVWTLPELRALFKELPDRLQVVIAGDPMWRGGLSGPHSIFLHVDRPLITNDSTSPLIHEIVHSLMHARSGDDGQWISEGLAEYYSIALLRRAGTLTATRYASAIEAMRKRGDSVNLAEDAEMTTARRAAATVAMIEIDEAIRSASGGARSLDDVVRSLSKADRRLTLKRLREAANEAAGLDLSALFDRYEN